MKNLSKITLVFITCFLSVNIQAQIINTIAGDGVIGYNGDGIPATSAYLNDPSSIAVDGSGNVYFVDGQNNRVRKISPSGIITTVVGTGYVAYGTINSDGSDDSSFDGIAATAAQISSSYVTLDSSGNLYVLGDGYTDMAAYGGGGYLYKINSLGIMNLVLGRVMYGNACTSSYELFNVAFVGNMNIYFIGPCAIPGIGNSTINTFNTPTIFAGGGSSGLGDGGPAIDAEVNTEPGTSPCLVFDRIGNAYFSDVNDGNRIRKVNTSGIITTFAGGGTSGFVEGGLASTAELGDLAGVAIDGNGNIYIAAVNDYFGGEANVIYKIDTSGFIYTVVGGGSSGLGDGGPATAAELSINGFAVDMDGNIYIADGENNRIRKVTSTSTSITSIPPSNPHIQLFPSPNNGNFTITAQFLDNDNSANIDIINAIGQVVYKDEAALQNGQLRKQITAQIPDGVYLLRINAGQANETVRFTVSK